MNDTVFTITAMQRPEILKQTLESFQFISKLKDHICCINVDSFSNDLTKSNECIEIAEQYFGDVIHSYGEGNFSKALKNVWLSACMLQPKYVFHLEDDWLLLRPQSLINLKSYLNLKNVRPEPILQVAIRAYRHSLKSGRFQLAPNVMPLALIDEFLEKEIIKKRENPEDSIRRYLKQTDRSQSTIYTTSDVILKDIGRQYMKDNLFTHNGNRKTFVSWRQCTQEETWLIKNQNKEIDS